MQYAPVVKPAHASGNVKTHLAGALGNVACRKFKSVRYVRMPELLDELSIAKSCGEFKKTIKNYHIKNYQKIDLLILDEWLIRSLTSQESYDLLEIAETRCSHNSMICCTQYETGGAQMKQKVKQIAATLIFGIVWLMNGPAWGAAPLTLTVPALTITINSQTIDNQNQAPPLLSHNGIVYLPLTNWYCKFTGLDVFWSPQLDTVAIHTQSEKSSTFVARPVASEPTASDYLAEVFSGTVQLNGKNYNDYSTAYPFVLVDETLYMPLSWQVAVEGLGWQYNYSQETGLTLDTNPKWRIENPLAMKIVDPGGYVSGTILAAEQQDIDTLLISAQLQFLKPLHGQRLSGFTDNGSLQLWREPQVGETRTFTFEQKTAAAESTAISPVMMIQSLSRWQETGGAAVKCVVDDIAVRHQPALQFGSTVSRAKLNQGIPLNFVIENATGQDVIYEPVNFRLQIARITEYGEENVVDYVCETLSGQIAANLDMQYWGPVWNGTDAQGNLLSPGHYIYTISLTTPMRYRLAKDVMIHEKTSDTAFLNDRIYSISRFEFEIVD